MPAIRLHSVEAKPHSSAAMDVIFIHGLGGDHLETWHPRGHPEAYFPRWLAKDIEGVNVWSLDYPASATKWSSDASPMGLLVRSRNILDYLSASGIGERPTVFIAHSLGGLLVKQLLYTADTLNIAKWRPVLKNTKGVVFLATPHTGSALSQLASALSLLSMPTSLTKDLEKGSEYLLQLDEWFRQNARRLGIQVEAYHETEKVGMSLVVDAISANPGVLGCVPVAVDGDHFSICKPRDQTELVYRSTIWFVRRILGEITKSPKIMRLYFVPGYKSPFKELRHEILRQKVWSGVEIIDEDPTRLQYGLSHGMMDDSRCHIMFIDFVAAECDRGELEQAVELIRLSRSLGRTLSLKPVFVIYSKVVEFRKLVGKLKQLEQDALSRYFFLEQDQSPEQFSKEVNALYSRIVNEWLARPHSSVTLL
jgi:pimeloyl-ACP methyl ester carboxylesterase